MTPEQERLFAESIDSMERMATPGNVRLEAAKAVLARARTAEAAERERDAVRQRFADACGEITELRVRAEDAERELAGAREDAERWRFGVETGEWPTLNRQLHPTTVVLGWRTRSQHPANGVPFYENDWPYYPSANASIDAARAAQTDAGDAPQGKAS